MSEPAAGQAIPIRPRATTRSQVATTRASHRPTPPHDDLERHKGAIKRLYLDDGHTLREVMGLMEKQYGVKASLKVYKSRFKTWGWRKNLRIEDEVLPNVLQGRSQQPRREFQLVNGQVVHSERLDRYLRRQKSRLLLLRRQLDQQAVQSQLCPRPRSLAPPDRFHVVEELFHQILFQVPTYVRHRWGDALLKTDLRGAIQLTHPTAHTDRWALFVWGLKCVLQAGKYDEAMVFMRHAPRELAAFLRSRPTEILSCGFMVLAQGTRFCDPDGSPQARQFLRVVRSLTRYAASVLLECAQASDSTWLHLVASLIGVFSRVEDRDLTETVYRAWEIHSRTWDSIMPARVSSQLPLAAGDALSVAKYRVLPRLRPGAVEVLQDMADGAAARHGARHEASMRALWAFAQWMETEDDARGLPGPGPGPGHGYSARTRGLFEELRRRGPEAAVKVAVWRFFANDHRARGEHGEAEQSLRRAIEAVGELWPPPSQQQQQAQEEEEEEEEDPHPLVLGYVSTLRDWLAEFYGEDDARALEAARWHAELKNKAMDPRNAPRPAPTGSPGSGA